MSPETNLWHCLGACNTAGDVIAWVMKTRGVSFRHAVERLRADHPSLAAQDGKLVGKGTTVKLEAPIAANADEQGTLPDVMAFYRRTLTVQPTSSANWSNESIEA